MKQYHDLMAQVREQGTRKTDRTGTGTLSVFGHQMRFDLRAGFPLVTTKKFISNRWCMNFCGSCAAIPTRPICASMASPLG